MARMAATGTIAFILCAILSVSGAAQMQIVIDFEDGKTDGWEFIDESVENVGGDGPSTWAIRSSQHGMDGDVLHQGSNIWGSALDESMMGTFAIYTAKTFTNFILDVDVFPEDNDGQGLVWAYEDTDRHYRAMMVNDAWPDPPVDGIKGPAMKIQKRISDEKPWHELITASKDDYVNFTESNFLHWTLEVIDGEFTFTREDGFSISGADDAYESGFVGIQLYALEGEFDNFTITPLPSLAVEPAGKVAIAWGALKGAQ